MNTLKLMIAVLLGTMAAACGQHTTVSAAFDDPRGLATGIPVYLGAGKVGEVKGLTAAGDLVEAELSLDPELTAGLHSGSAALLTTRGSHTVIELYNYRPGGEPLESGATLVGLDSSFELAAWQAGEALDTGTKSVGELSRSVSEYFDSDEWHAQKDRMNRQIESLKQELGRSYAETNAAYRQFLKDLENRSDLAREKARESYAELAKRLREQMARLREQGDEKIVQPLQDLLQELERAMAKTPRQESA